MLEVERPSDDSGIKSVVSRSELASQPTVSIKFESGSTIVCETFFSFHEEIDCDKDLKGYKSI